MDFQELPLIFPPRLASVLQTAASRLRTRHCTLLTEYETMTLKFFLLYHKFSNFRSRTSIMSLNQTIITETGADDHIYTAIVIGHTFIKETL